MKKQLHTLLLIPVLALFALVPISLSAADSQPATATAPLLKYKLIKGLKDAFIDDLQLHLSKGWIPVGGVSVTVWNNDLYFAQLISKKSD